MASLVDLWYTAIEGRTVPDDGIQIARISSGAMDQDKAVFAQSILILAGSSQDRNTALEQLKESCRAFSDSPKARVVLLLTLEQLPRAQLRSSNSFAILAYESASHTLAAIRINAMRVLRRFAKMGDPQGIQILKNSLKDTDAEVRKAASVALKLAGIETIS